MHQKNLGGQFLEKYEISLFLKNSATQVLPLLFERDRGTPVTLEVFFFQKMLQFNVSSQTLNLCFFTSLV